MITGSLVPIKTAHPSGAQCQCFGTTLEGRPLQVLLFVLVFNIDRPNHRGPTASSPVCWHYEQPPLHGLEDAQGLGLKRGCGR